MRSKSLLRAFVLLALLASLIPSGNVVAATTLPPADMFQLPWDQGLAWYAIDGFDNGTKRPLNSSHHYTVGGAIDFAPRNNMVVGEDTSNFWVAAAAAGVVVEKSFCHVKIDHGNGWVTEYQFLANVPVKVGDAVHRNQRLGIIADGVRNKFCPGSLEPNVPHVHFTLRPTMRNVTFAGWLISYIPILNKTTFTKGDKSVGLFQPLLNTLDLQIVFRGPITWDVVYTGSVDTYRYERWSMTLDETNKFTLTATPTSSGLVPQISLLDSNGTEIARGTGTLTSTQPAGSYFVQIQPQVGNGFYTLVLTKEELPLPTGPYTSVVVNPPSINVGETALVTVNLNNIPAEGYTSAEFTCTYNESLVQVSNIAVTDLFGADPAVAINGPQGGSFIVAIAGSGGSRATSDGAAFTFNVTGLQAGQTSIECKARVSKGDNVLTEIESLSANLTVTGSTPPPTVTPTPTESSTPDVPVTPTFTATPTSPPTGDWLTFTNSAYGFEFKYPPQGVIADGRTDTFARIDLPFAAGTNLSEKYLEVIVVENADPCRSPLATSSILETSETVIVNGITFLKETGGDGGAGHLHQWIAYSTLRDHVCVSLDFILHSLNPGNFSTPPPVFDFAAESAVFGQIVSTYVWLEQQTPTPTPTVTTTPEVSPTPTASPTSTLPPSTDGTVTGTVLAGKPVAVGLYDGNTLVASVNANPDGSFSLTVPAGSYTIVAVAGGFLGAQGTVTLTGGNTIAKPTVTLLAGDIDNNDVIDQLDAMTIGMNYNAATPSAADLNNDGIINVLDLEALAENYREAGPLAW